MIAKIILEMKYSSYAVRVHVLEWISSMIHLFIGEYSCLSVDLVFKRQFSYYLITIYVPGCMLVIVSWVSFWLDPHAVPARVALGVTTLLTMSTQTASINSALPPVAYTKAIDVWQVNSRNYNSVFTCFWDAFTQTFCLFRFKIP